MEWVSEEFLSGLSPRKQFLRLHSFSLPRFFAALFTVDRGAGPRRRAGRRDGLRRARAAGHSLSASGLVSVAAPCRRTDFDLCWPFFLVQNQERARSGLAWTALLQKGRVLARVRRL